MTPMSDGASTVSSANILSPLVSQNVTYKVFKRVRAIDELLRLGQAPGSNGLSHFLKIAASTIKHPC